jgi:RNA polymerase sigma-70 factor (ECF subfamily)
VIDAVYRAESRWVLATLIRLLGGFELAEEALHEAFVAAVEQSPHEDPPLVPFGRLGSRLVFRMPT